MKVIVERKCAVSFRHIPYKTNTNLSPQEKKGLY